MIFHVFGSHVCPDVRDCWGNLSVYLVPSDHRALEDGVLITKNRSDQEIVLLGKLCTCIACTCKATVVPFFTLFQSYCLWFFVFFYVFKHKLLLKRNWFLILLPPSFFFFFFINNDWLISIILLKLRLFLFYHLLIRYDPTRLLLTFGANVNTTDKVKGNTPLHWACLSGNHIIIKVLLGRGADIYAVNLKVWFSPILFFFISKSLELSS